MVEYKLLPFLKIIQVLNFLLHLEIFVNTKPYDAGNFKTLLPTVFTRSKPNFVRILATMVEYRVLFSWAIGKGL